jgi:arylsulfatase
MKGHRAEGKEFKVYLDGHNFLSYLTGKEEQGPRKEFFYFSDDGLPVGVRHKQWKLVFAEQRARTFRVWSEPFVQLRIPKLFKLRSDLFERADTDSNNYNRWGIERSAFSVTVVQEIVAGFIGTFKDYPPRQKPAKFNVDDVMKSMYKKGAH